MAGFEPSEEQKLIRHTIAEFAQEQIRPLAHDADESGSVPTDLIQQGWELGLVQSSRMWAATVKHLDSLGLPEATQAAKLIRDELLKQSPRLMRRGMEEFLVYHPHAAADEQAAQVNTVGAARLRLDLRAAAGTFSLAWYRAADGQSLDGEDVAAGDWRELTAPWPGADIVVRLRRR